MSVQPDPNYEHNVLNEPFGESLAQGPERSRVALRARDARTDA